MCFMWVKFRNEFPAYSPIHYKQQRAYNVDIVWSIRPYS